MACLNDETLAAAIGGANGLPPQLVEHLADCESCRVVAAELAREETLPFVPVLPIGHVVLGRYLIVRFLAQGGMGEVYEARDAWLNEQVALKTIRNIQGPTGERLRRRFRSEVQTARRVQHPNVCRLLESGLVRVGDVELPFLTMELLDGQPLSQYLQRRGPLLPNETRDILRQICAAMVQIHRQGILHRDLKPENVFVLHRSHTDELRIKLIDFGLAKDAIASSDSAGGKASTLGGTPAFMAPELHWGSEATVATDVYSFGVLLREMLRSSSRGSPFKTKLSAFAARCVVADPAARPPSFESIATNIDKAFKATPRWRYAAGIAGAVAMAAAIALINIREPARTPPPLLANPKAVVIQDPVSVSDVPKAAIVQLRPEPVVVGPVEEKGHVVGVQGRRGKSERRRPSPATPLQQGSRRKPSSAPPDTEVVFDPYL